MLMCNCIGNLPMCAFTHLLEASKGVGSDVLCNRHVPLGRPHVLPQRQHVHVCTGIFTEVTANINTAMRKRSNCDAHITLPTA